MVKLKIAENLCLNILYILDKKSHFAQFINQSMINNLNNKHRFGAGFRSYIISVPAPSLCLLFINKEQIHDRP